MSNLHGFTLRKQLKWVNAYPLIAGFLGESPTPDQVNEAFMKLVNSKNIGHVLRLQDNWSDEL